MEHENWMKDIATKLSGVIFKKALLEGDWTKVYENVFFHMYNEDFDDEMSFLRVFGDCGG